MSINIPIWLPLLVLVVVFGVWHIHENRRLTRHWQKTLDVPLFKELKRFAWSRTTQFLIALLFCVLIIIIYDFRLNTAQNEQTEMSKIISTLEQKNSVLSAKKEEPVQPVIAAIIPSPKPPVSIVENEPLDTVDSVYNPEETTPDKQSKLDSIKKRYEDILVTYFFLRKCDKINPSDYHVIISALSQEMASVNAPGRMQNDILTAAQGSYKEVYSTSNCNAENIDATYSQYSNYINTLTKEYIPQ